MYKRIIILMIIIFTSMTSAEAEENFGIVDIMSRVNMTNMNDEHINMVQGASDMIAKKLMRQTNVSVINVTGDATKARLDEIYLQLTQGICTEFKDYNCDYIIYGYLMNLTLSEGKRIAERSEAVHVNLSIRVVDVKSGKCVFVAAGDGVSKARNYGVYKFRIGQKEFSEEELHSALEEATDKIVELLRKNI